MKNKALLLVIFLIAFCINAEAQLINCNPDLEGEPWWAGGTESLTEDYYNSIPKLGLSPLSEGVPLPISVDNSQLQYFPFIFSQISGSCAQASAIGYIFTYEINRVRNLPSTGENLYPHLYSYNLVRWFPWTPDGSTQQEGWDLAMQTGIPNEIVFDNPYNPGDPEVTLYWMSGYDKYLSALNNKVKAHYTIELEEDGSNIDLLKHWLFDHNAAEPTGGLGSISVNISDYQHSTYPPGFPEAGKRFVTKWGVSGGHAMTIVGYNDEVKYDWGGVGFNGNIQPDGQFRNDWDNNLDGVIDMRDWEIGAVKLANSWGPFWPTPEDEGFIYMPYYLFADLMHAYKVYVCEVEESYNPELVLKAELFHGERTNLTFYSAYGTTANSGPIFNFTPPHLFLQGTGGPNPINGYNNSPLEFVFDFGYLYGNYNIGKVIPFVFNQSSIYNAEFNYLSMIDYRWEEEFELNYYEIPLSLPNGIHYLDIPYHLIPHETDIEEDLTFSSDMVSRFFPTVSNGATLTIEDGVNIDMYNSEISIDPGSSLIIEDDVTFIAKKGICKIRVDGNLSTGSNVSFHAEEGAQLWLTIYNNNLNLTFENASFINTALIAYNNSNTIHQSTFENSGVYGFKGNLHITNSDFTGSFVKASDASQANRIVRVEYCNFYGSSSTAAIDINNYPDFQIKNNVINDGAGGISLFYSGSGRHHVVSNNWIMGNYLTGITSYNTRVDIIHNVIANNSYGIKCLDRSSVHIEGDSQDITQVIRDNSSFEIYATKGSFPNYFKWNLVRDDDNLPGDPMVKYSGTEPGLDVRYNCWGNNFNAVHDLEPPESYIWNPVWDCNIPGGSGFDPGAETLYLSCRQKTENEDYTGATSDFQQIILLYPSTKFAQASLKELFALESYTGNNYAGLKTFYLTENAIQNNPALLELADFLVNFCDIRLENWPTAIAWFEDVIQEPATFEDSIFAIIDLGYTYWLMENNGLKSSYTGAMPQYKFASQEVYEENRDYLLSLLPGDGLSKTMKLSLSKLKTGELMQNVPNPFKGASQLWYKVDEASVVALHVYDNIGRNVRTIDCGEQTEGAHFVEFTSEGLPPGVYFYTLEINGRVTDSKKMTIMQ
jgi:hypothetical protein